MSLLLWFFTWVIAATLSVIDPIGHDHAVSLGIGVEMTTGCPPMELERHTCAQTCVHHDFSISIDSWYWVSPDRPCP